MPGVRNTDSRRRAAEKSICHEDIQFRCRATRADFTGGRPSRRRFLGHLRRWDGQRLSTDHIWPASNTEGCPQAQCGQDYPLPLHPGGGRAASWKPVDTLKFYLLFLRVLIGGGLGAVGHPTTAWRRISGPSGYLQYILRTRHWTRSF